MLNLIHLRRKLFLALATTLLLAPGSAMANWTFDSNNCSPLTKHEIKSVPPPAVMIMLDKSGSMDWRFDGYTTNNTALKRWTSAKAAINTLTLEAMNSTPNTIEFGLGLFGTAVIRQEAKANANASIMSILNSTSPSGGTPTAQAIEKMYNSKTVRGTEYPYTDRATIGLLVTDGEPDNQVTAVQEACNHRNVAPMYVIGMGKPEGKQFNDIMAAAGGTGTCGNLQDICTVSGLTTSKITAYRGKCTGSFQTDNPAQLQQALTTITNAISCTYPLTVLGGGTVPPSNQGCEGYDCVSVSLSGGIGRIYHEDSNHPALTQNPEKRGWSWVSATERKLVKLNPTYCSKVQSGTTRIIDTQVACLCSQQFDTRCDVYDPDTCECPTGRWTCNYGTDICQPSTGTACGGPREGEGQTCSNGKLGICEELGQTVCGSDGRLNCNAGPGPAPRTEVCNGLDDNCNGIVDDVAWEGIAACHVDFGRNNAKIQAETIRCNIGHASCVNAQEICIPLLPMPEVCNGLDDDCDGRIDNLANSLKRYNEDLRFTPDHSIELAPERPALSGDLKAAACFERDICNCPTSIVNISSPEYMSDDYDDYLDTYWRVDNSGQPVCTCSSGLTQ